MSRREEEQRRSLLALQELTQISPLHFLEVVCWQHPFPATELWEYDEEEDSHDERWKRNVHFPRFDRAESVLTELRQRGADIVYVALVLLYWSDDSKWVEWQKSNEKELEEEFNNSEQVKILRRMQQEDIPKLDVVFGPTLLQRLSQAVEELLAEPRLRITKMEQSIPIKPLCGHRVRRPEYGLNLIILLLSEHLAENIKLQKGYDVIARLLHSAFPRFLPNFNHEHVRSRLNTWASRLEAITDCRAFQTDFKEVPRLLREDPLAALDQARERRNRIVDMSWRP